MSSFLLYTEFLNTTWWEFSPVYTWSIVVGSCDDIQLRQLPRINNFIVQPSHSINKHFPLWLLLGLENCPKVHVMSWNTLHRTFDIWMACLLNKLPMCVGLCRLLFFLTSFQLSHLVKLAILFCLCARVCLLQDEWYHFVFLQHFYQTDNVYNLW